MARPRRATELYLQTVRTLFRDDALPRGCMRWRGVPVDLVAVRDTGLMTVEAERDDISRLLRALLLQVFYSVRSERLLMEQLDLQPLVPMVRGPRDRRSDLASDRVYHHPRPAARR